MASRATELGWLVRTLGAATLAAYAMPLFAQSRTNFGAQTTGAREPSSNVSSSTEVVAGTADAVIEEMSQAAGVIFAGQVTAVRRTKGSAGLGENASEGIVEVDFRVDQAVRGPVAGSVYTLREWSGLWGGGGEHARYRAGQRLLMLLYQPDGHGMSSPVHGRDGAVPLRGGGVAPGADDTTSSAGAWMVDLRWVQARALKSSALVMLPVLRPVTPRPIHSIISDGDRTRGTVEPEPDLMKHEPVAISMAAAPPVETQSLAQVLALCQQAVRRGDAGQ